MAQGYWAPKWSWSGCAPNSYTRTGYRGADGGDSLPPPMTAGDVIELSKAKVGDAVIIGQIRSTESIFQLGTKDIVQLKQAGVSDTVIAAMVSTAGPASFRRAPYGYGYAYPGWYYPYGWYPGFYAGFRYFWPHFPFYHGGYGRGFYRGTLGTFGGHNYGRPGLSGGFGGGRPFGSHR